MPLSRRFNKARIKLSNFSGRDAALAAESTSSVEALRSQSAVQLLVERDELTYFLLIDPETG